MKWIDEVLALALTQQRPLMNAEPPAPVASELPEDKRPRRTGRRSIKQPVPAH